jgi:hypothetical protein
MRDHIHSTVLLLGLAALLLAAYGWSLRHGPALADEFIYLAGARHLAATGSLDARYYDAEAILQIGHPHHDVHAPGYVFFLALASLVAGPGYTAAVLLNVVAFAACVLLARLLALELGVDPAGALAAGALTLVVPGLLPYVFWAMAECVLAALVLAALWSAARAGENRGLALAAGAGMGVAFLVRESALFALPAAVLLTRARRFVVFGFLGVALLVYAPLSVHRAPGGANFWRPTSGRAFGFESVAALQGGRASAALAHVTARAAANVRELASPGTTWTERGILGLYGGVVLLALAGSWGGPERLRAYARAMAAGAALVTLLLFGVYVVGQWSGFRYAMFLVPPLLPAAVAARRWRWAAVALLAVSSLALVVPIRGVLDAYKASRQRRQAAIAEYVERHVPGSPSRIALGNGWLYGWRHYPTEVVSSVPADRARLRLLEQVVWFDYLVLAGDDPLREQMDARIRYERVNAGEVDAALAVYRRLR